MATTDREAAKELAAKWIQQACDYDTMAKDMQYTPLEARLLRMQAHVKRECAQELRIEMSKMCRRG
jgi:hypothetical protein